MVSFEILVVSCKDIESASLYSQSYECIYNIDFELGMICLITCRDVA